MNMLSTCRPPSRYNGATMNSLAVALVLLAGACFASVPDRIVGGQYTSIEEYPSIVQVESLGAITNIWSQNCAANILTSRWVVSAAHCFEGLTYRPDRRRIRAGSTYRNTGGQVTPIIREHNHPSYGRLGLDGDITVVSLEDPLVYNPVIAAGSIISPNYVFPDGTPVIHAGWGHTTQGGLSSERLQDVTIYTINNDDCRERYLTLPRPGIVTENMICAGIDGVGGKDACQGDSGGPLYFRDATDTLILVGVVSWGHGCANETFPGISTAVSSYTNWIVETAQ